MHTHIGLHKVHTLNILSVSAIELEYNSLFSQHFNLAGMTTNNSEDLSHNGTNVLLIIYSCYFVPLKNLFRDESGNMLRMIQKMVWLWIFFDVTPHLTFYYDIMDTTFFQEKDAFHIQQLYQIS